MKRAKQGDFFDYHASFSRRRLSHGGDTRIGRRKLIRPLDRKRPIHLVLRSSSAKGKLSLLGAKNRISIARILTDRARQFGVKLHAWQNVGNHLHIVLSLPSRRAFQDFLRTVTSLIARTVTGTRRGKPFGARFWDHVAFTRVVSAGKDYRGVRAYIELNRIEAEEGPQARKVVEEFKRRRKEARKVGWDDLNSE